MMNACTSTVNATLMLSRRIPSPVYGVSLVRRRARQHGVGSATDRSLGSQYAGCSSCSRGAWRGGAGSVVERGACQALRGVAVGITDGRTVERPGGGSPAAL